MFDGKDNVSTLKGTRRLADAVRAAKIAAAQRSDVVVDIREADRARLEIFAEAFQSVVDEVPTADDVFDFTISGGMHPRYWIDGTTHVSMARDRRTYRLVRETRLGRITLAEGTDAKLIVDRATDYVAERLVERDKALAESDGYGLQAVRRREAGRQPEVEPPRAPLPAVAARRTDVVIPVIWTLIGMVIGAGILFAIALLRGFSLN